MSRCTISRESNYRKRLTGDLTECTPSPHLLVKRLNFGRSEISKRPYNAKKDVPVMDDDYRQVFYKQISRIDRVFNRDGRSSADGETPYASLMTLENYDEQASLDEILLGM